MPFYLLLISLNEFIFFLFRIFYFSHYFLSVNINIEKYVLIIGYVNRKRKAYIVNDLTFKMKQDS
ncbi:hypothetical protein BACERE00177_05413 [Bacillus mobilis]|nr:hypothetical protein BACERE00177_05413 [Bacillus mobilis]